MPVNHPEPVPLFLVNTPAATGGGGYSDSYATLLTTRGQLINSGDNRSLSFGAIADSNFMRLICRFQTALASGLRSDTKIVIDGITYTMNGRPKLINQRKHVYEFSIQAQTLNNAIV